VSDRRVVFRKLMQISFCNTEPGNATGQAHDKLRRKHKDHGFINILEARKVDGNFRREIFQVHCAQVWCNPEQWARMSILNVARCWYFSSDRAIREYSEDIWNVTPLPLETFRA
jgi:glucan phosphorylase